MNSLSKFPVYLVNKDEAGVVRAEIVEKCLEDLPTGEVLIEVAYSSINYKDALSATGHAGVTRKFPHVPGVDAAGRVVQSQSPLFRQGDEVLVTGFDQGQNTWGGFAAYVRVPAGWVVPLPAGLNLRDSMVYGTAGLTAGLCTDALIARGVSPGMGEVVVTGASGGVGSVAVALLAHLGYQVVAVTGKTSAQAYLRQLGAARVVPRQEVDDSSNKPLLSARWAGAVDTVGGNTLATLIRQMQRNGCVAACGLVGGAELPLTVYPFILRGVDLVGVDSAECALERRKQIWTKLAGPWRPATLEKMVTEIPLAQLAPHLQQILAGEVTGRIVVTLPSAAR